MIYLIALFCFIGMILFLVLFIRTKSTLSDYRKNFEPIVDIYDEVKKLTKKKNELKVNFNKNKVIYDELLKDIKLYEERLEAIEFGHYEPAFGSDDSEILKARITEIRNQQKLMMTSKTACICQTEWTVEGSKSKGKKMMNHGIQLMLRSFNGECDAIISKVTWSNIDRIEERLNKTFEKINKLGESNKISIHEDYLNLKIEEAHLYFEYEETKREEKEEQRRIKEEMREEEKARREFEKAQKDAEKEEDLKRKAVEEAQADFDKASDEQKAEFEAKLKELQAQLKEAQEKSKRAISQAQLTKSGHVYVISNIGSFGEGTFKIGMTRRLEPLDRVKELGDASVPFEFDVHAMIYSNDAPRLEAELHQKFNDYRINKVNLRKEFFHAHIKDIENAVHQKGLDIEFTKLAEAREFRESLAMLPKNDVETKATSFELQD